VESANTFTTSEKARLQPLPRAVRGVCQGLRTRNPTLDADRAVVYIWLYQNAGVLQFSGDQHIRTQRLQTFPSECGGFATSRVRMCLSGPL
jgi:hypothetical protein